MIHEKMSHQFIKRFAIIKNICLCQIDSSAFAQAGRHAPSTPQHQPLFSQLLIILIIKNTFLGVWIYLLTT